MANAEAWSQGFSIGQGAAHQQFAHKQAIADEEFQSKVHDIAQNRLDLQAKLPTLLDENGKPTPEYHETMTALEQNLKDMRDMFHPQKNPGAIQKFGHILTDALHITKPTPTPTMVIPNPKGLVEAGNLPIWDRPAVQNMDGTYSSEYSTSFQDKNGHEVLVPTIVDGKFLTPDGKKPPEGSDAEKQMFQKAWQHYEQTGQNLGKFASPEDADRYANRLHNRGKIPKEIQKQEVKQAAGAAADKRGAQQLAAAAPVSPVQAATTAAGAKNAGDLAIIQGKMKNLKTLFPDAPPELQKKWFEELAQSITGIKAGQEKYFSSLATTKDANGQEHYWRVPMAPDQNPEEVDFDGQTMVPKTTAAASKPVRAWKRDDKGKILSVMIDPKTNQMVPGSENYDVIPPSYLVPKISTGVYHWVDQDNQIHETPESHTTRPALQGGGSPSSGPTIPPSSNVGSSSGPKHNIGKRSIQGGSSSPRVETIKDKILGIKSNAPLNGARKMLSDATRLSALADVWAQRAEEHPDDMSEADGQFVLALIRSEAGRVNQQEIAQVFGAGGIEEAPERWAAKVGHGQLSTDLRNQLIEFTHDMQTASAAAVAALHQGPDDAQSESKKHKIQIGNKFYVYKGTGKTDDITNYDEVSK